MAGHCVSQTCLSLGDLVASEVSWDLVPTGGLVPTAAGQGRQDSFQSSKGPVPNRPPAKDAGSPWTPSSEAAALR